MAINRPPLTGNPALDSWADEVTRELSLSSASATAPSSTVVGGGTGGALNSATLTLYKRYTSDTLPGAQDITVSTTYRFSTTVLTNDSTASTTNFDNWERTVPSTGGPYVFSITVNIASSTDYETIAAADWSTPVLFVEDGARGAGRWNVPVSTLPASSANAETEWNAWADKPGDPVDKDQAWFYTGTESAPTGQNVWIYDLGTDSWTQQTEVTDGDLLIDTTVDTPKLIDESTSVVRSDFGNYTGRAINRTNYPTVVTGNDYEVVSASLTPYTGVDVLVVVNVKGINDSTADPIPFKVYSRRVSDGFLTTLRSFTCGTSIFDAALSTTYYFPEEKTIYYVYSKPADAGEDTDFILAVDIPGVTPPGYGQIDYPLISIQEVKK